MASYAWTIAEVLLATGGRSIGGSAAPSFSAIGIDSRTIAADHLFVAIAGESHDGHDYVDAV
ncbi:MAG TPA: Mur ligase domain-containing protein, partial [Desulfosarcina sp.]|nr:Mur ligase domain-containing protein [Desulfosarcina sp.]